MLRTPRWPIRRTAMGLPPANGIVPHRPTTTWNIPSSPPLAGARALRWGVHLKRGSHERQRSLAVYVEQPRVRRIGRVDVFLDLDGPQGERQVRMKAVNRVDF